jgi:hypothetical protein
MSKGLFYEERPKTVCGFFYYNEVESTIYLSYRKPLVAFNKTEAAKLLLKEKEDETLSGVLKHMIMMAHGMRSRNNQFILEHIKGNLPSDLMFTPKMASSLGIIEREPPESDRKVYLGADKLNLYAYEDDLDQPL